MDSKNSKKTKKRNLARKSGTKQLALKTIKSAKKSDKIFKSDKFPKGRKKSQLGLKIAKSKTLLVKLSSMREKSPVKKSDKSLGGGLRKKKDGLAKKSRIGLRKRTSLTSQTEFKSEIETSHKSKNRKIRKSVLKLPKRSKSKLATVTCPEKSTKTKKRVGKIGVKKSLLRFKEPQSLKEGVSLSRTKFDIDNQQDCMALIKLLQKRMTPWTKTLDQEPPTPKMRLKRKKFKKAKGMKTKKIASPKIVAKPETVSEKPDVTSEKSTKEPEMTKEDYLKMSTDMDVSLCTEEGLEPDDLEDLNDELLFVYKDSNTLYHSYGQILQSLMNMQQRRQGKRKGLAPVVKLNSNQEKEEGALSTHTKDFVQMMMDKKDLDYGMKFNVEKFNDATQSEATFKELFKEIEDIYSAGEVFRSCFDKEGYIHMNEYIRRKFKITRPQYEVIFGVAKSLRDQVQKILEAYSGAFLDMFRLTASEIELPVKEEPPNCTSGSKVSVERKPTNNSSLDAAKSSVILKKSSIVKKSLELKVAKVISEKKVGDIKESKNKPRKEPKEDAQEDASSSIDSDFVSKEQPASTLESSAVSDAKEPKSEVISSSVAVSDANSATSKVESETQDD